MVLEKFQEENPGARQAMRELIGRARSTGEAAFIFVNNRLEGNAPGTIEAVVEEQVPGARNPVSRFR